MEELSQELTAIILEGKKEKFHDIVVEMLHSLAKAQEMVKKVDFLVLRKDKTD